jgi:predicted metal-dependent HD superfamily phosphohydrolase
VILIYRHHQAIAGDAPGCDGQVIFHLDQSDLAHAAPDRPACER